MKKATIPLVVCVLLSVYGCSTRKLPPGPTGLYQLEGDWQLVSTTDDDSALNGTVISVDPVTADGMITVLQKNRYCVRPTDVMWKELSTSAGSGQFKAGCLVSSCISGLEYKPATLQLLNNEVRLTGTNAYGKFLLQTWRRRPK
ncbi:hypothetical protein [Sediminibacterium soli]|uniref:hypothetical protein n=1 Tax=Sediminibacterium soli TaxID=2698829 RepID=UPI00137B52A9|nr:hypothetical protein [Sediminibacterium soli]NCI46128.1 hypothetical protein [Sediminibacterium soli]